MNNYFLSLTYTLDELAIIMIGLISYIGICVISFSSRYMKGDTKYKSFFIHLILLICSVSIMVISDHLALLLLTSCFSNLILVRLMIHKHKWKAAYASGMITAKNYLLSAICMTLSFTLFYLSTGKTSVSFIIHQSNDSIFIQIALLLLLVAAMAQSAIWPFHTWLISSLNSPTPVSAIMHAGLINGGGFLLVRFAPLYLQHYNIMVLIFFIGMISALLGTLWKLMQNDVKRMLACSTMGQMGFMFVQCGLGLFSLAVAHLFWHGMFKAYLFLSSASAAQEKQFDLSYQPKILSFIYSFFCGAFGSFVFAYTSNKSWFAKDSTLVLMVIVFLAGAQLSFQILQTSNFRKFFLAFIFTIIGALIYGASIQFIVIFLNPMELMHPQKLNIVHIVGIIVLILSWLSVFFIRSSSKIISDHSSFILKSYVKALNSSQPHSDTITAYHNDYKY